MSREPHVQPIILIGMSRSGTTVVTSLLSKLPNVYLESEPQLLWRMGNFQYLADDQYDLRPEVAAEIRRRLLAAAGDRRLVEKSPSNCLRPDLVHAAFPDATIVYLERDPVRCVASHLQLADRPARLSFHLKRYLTLGKQRDNLPSMAPPSHRNNLLANSVRRQLRRQDIPEFLRYVHRMLVLGNCQRLVPFGVKVDGFWDIMRNEGRISYHVAALEKAQQLKPRFRELYGERMYEARLEDLFQRKEALSELLEFCAFRPSLEELQGLARHFDRQRVSKAIDSRGVDVEIRALLSSI